jgi:sialidase-1
MNVRFAAVALALAAAALGCATTLAQTDEPVVHVEWDRLPDLPRPLAGQSAGVSRGALIVAGGSDFPTPPWEGGRKIWLDDIYLLAPGASAWRAAGRLAQPLAYAAAASVGDRLVLAGGSDGVRHFGTVVSLEAAGESVVSRPLASLPAPLAMAGAAILGQTLYVVGGQAAPDADTASADVRALDLSQPAGTWQTVAPLPGPGRILPVVVAQAGRLYVFSGARLRRDAQGAVTRDYLTDAWAFAPGSGWRPMTDAPHPVVAAPALARGPSHILVFGGDTGADAARVAELREKHPGFNREVLAYHTITNTWRPIGALNAGLVTTSAVALGDRIVIAGGEDRPGHRSAAVWSGRSREAGAPSQVDVFVAGEGGYHTYRIPSIVATRRGTLLAFAEARRAGAGDAGDIDLVLRRSRDEGRTWSPMRVVGDNGPNTFGNPCPVIDSRTGVVWLLTTHNLGVDRERDILAGTSQGTRTVWVMKSDDDGESWSAPVEITSSVKRPDWTWYATGPGVGIETASGRLVIPANHAEAGTGEHRSHVFFSDDQGRSWRLGASLEPGTNESQIAELSRGRLLLNMRNHPPRAENYRLVATSDDHGASFSPARPDPALVEPPAQASLIAVRDVGASSDARLLLFANPASMRRERLTVRLSEDEGATWAAARVVHEGSSAYSSLTALPGGAAGLLYERGDRSPYERITFARFTIGWIRENRTR